jgi:hypothetical protein
LRRPGAGAAHVIDGAPPAKPKGEALPSEMVAAVAAGKHSTAISLHFALASPPTSRLLPVRIAIVPHQPFATVSVHFESHDGLTMPDGEDFRPVNDVSPEKPLSHSWCCCPPRKACSW